MDICASANGGEEQSLYMRPFRGVGRDGKTRVTLLEGE